MCECVHAAGTNPELVSAQWGSIKAKMSGLAGGVAVGVGRWGSRGVRQPPWGEPWIRSWCDKVPSCWGGPFFCWVMAAGVRKGRVGRLGSFKWLVWGWGGRGSCGFPVASSKCKVPNTKPGSLMHTGTDEGDGRGDRERTEMEKKTSTKWTPPSFNVTSCPSVHLRNHLPWQEAPPIFLCTKTC